MLRELTRTTPFTPEEREDQRLSDLPKTTQLPAGNTQREIPETSRGPGSATSSVGMSVAVRFQDYLPRSGSGQSVPVTQPLCLLLLP